MRNQLSSDTAPPKLAAKLSNGLLDKLLVTRSGLIAPDLPGHGDIPLLPSPFDSELRSLGRIGELEVLLAVKREVKRAQRLRYRVFYKTGNAIADAATLLSRRDRDRFDKICDHLIVVDHTERQRFGHARKPKVVGACRLLRQSVAEAHDGFYSAREFDLAGVTERHPHLKFLELGRFCVLPSYRSKRTAELLWQGIWRYVRHHRADVLIGCGSLEGTDPMLLAPQLSYLHHHGRAPDGWQARAKGRPLGLSIRTDWLAKDGVDVTEARRALPPLIKAYLRLGAFVGDGAVIDHQFGTTDVLIMLPIAAIGQRYIKHFTVDAPVMPVAVELAS
jgi:L-ornithine Nalpha-acyltransferase